MPFVFDFEEASNLIAQKTRIQDVIEESRYIVSDANDNSDESGSESDDSSKSSSYFGIENVAKTLADYTEELLQLGDIFSSPVPDQDDNISSFPSTTILNQKAHHLYAEFLLAMFPNAAAPLVDRLGKANWERKRRFQHKIEATETSTPTTIYANAGTKATSAITLSNSPNSKINKQLPSVTATMSFFSLSTGEIVQAQISHLPVELETGALFICGTCSKALTVYNHDQWKYVQALFARILLLTMIGNTSTKTSGPILVFSRTAHSMLQFFETERIGQTIFAWTIASEVHRTITYVLYVRKMSHRVEILSSTSRHT